MCPFPSGGSDDNDADGDGVVLILIVVMVVMVILMMVMIPRWQLLVLLEALAVVPMLTPFRLW